MPLSLRHVRKCGYKHKLAFMSELDLAASVHKPKQVFGVAWLPCFLLKIVMTHFTMCYQLVFSMTQVFCARHTHQLVQPGCFGPLGGEYADG